MHGKLKRKMPRLGLYLHSPAYRTVQAVKAHAHNIYALHIPARFYYTGTDIIHRLQPGKSKAFPLLAQSIIHADFRHAFYYLRVLGHSPAFSYNLVYNSKICYCGLKNIDLHAVIARLEKHGLFSL